MRELFNFVARPNFAKRKSRSPRGFLPRPLLRAGESALAPRLLFPRHFVAGCGFIFEKSSRECYNDTTKRDILVIRNAERIFGTKIRAVCPASALCGSDKIPKFAPIA